MPRLQGKILQKAPDEEYRFLLLDAVRTYFRLNKKEQVEERHLLEAPRYAEVRNSMLTEIQKLEVKAEAKALQNILLLILGSQFAPVPQDVERKIRRARSVGTLNDWILRASSAGSREEIIRYLGN